MPMVTPIGDEGWGVTTLGAAAGRSGTLAARLPDRRHRRRGDRQVGSIVRPDRRVAPHRRARLRTGERRPGPDRHRARQRPSHRRSCRWPNWPTSTSTRARRSSTATATSSASAPGVTTAPGCAPSRRCRLRRRPTHDRHRRRRRRPTRRRPRLRRPRPRRRRARRRPARRRRRRRRPPSRRPRRRRRPVSISGGGRQRRTRLTATPVSNSEAADHRAEGQLLPALGRDHRPPPRFGALDERLLVGHRRSPTVGLQPVVGDQPRLPRVTAQAGRDRAALEPPSQRADHLGDPVGQRDPRSRPAQRPHPLARHPAVRGDVEDAVESTLDGERDGRGEVVEVEELRRRVVLGRRAGRTRRRGQR